MPQQLAADGAGSAQINLHLGFRGVRIAAHNLQRGRRFRIVSGCAGCVPEPFVEVYRCWKAGDLEGAKKAQFTCFDLVKKLRYGADMSIFKHVLDDRGVGGGHMKAPLLDLEESAVEPLLETLRPYYNK